MHAHIFASGAVPHAPHFTTWTTCNAPQAEIFHYLEHLEPPPPQAHSHTLIYNSKEIIANLYVYLCAAGGVFSLAQHNPPGVGLRNS